MIYEHFNMRLHADDGTLDASSWEIRTGDGELNAFTVGSIVNPKPTAKKNLLDINGASGSLDLSEDNGRIFFESKPVTVILQGRSDFNGMDEIEDFLSPYQGRLMDFTTDNYLNVSGYQVGRMAAEISRKNNRITITFENVDPYRYGETHTLNVLCRTNYELNNNADNWVYGGETPAYSSDSPLHFRYSFYSPQGKIYRRVKGVGAQSGAKMIFGIRSIVGGEVWFVDEDGNRSKTIATVIEPESGVVPSGSTGEISMQFVVDGSYYEWVTVNGSRAYLPTIRCDYVLSNYAPIDIGSTGKIINYQGEYATWEIPSNVVIRPTFEAAAGVIICDGVAVNSPSNLGAANYYQYVPKIALNGFGADRSKKMVDSVFCWTPLDNSDVVVGSCSMMFTEAEVF